MRNSFATSSMEGALGQSPGESVLRIRVRVRKTLSVLRVSVRVSVRVRIECFVVRVRSLPRMVLGLG